MTIRKLLMFAMITACGEAPVPEPAPPAEAPARVIASNEFDPFAASIGDTIAGVRLATLDVQLALDSLPSGRAQFEGPIELAGEYRAHFDYPEVNVACFWVDSASSGKVPRMKGDSRRQNWFCFRNQDAVIRALGPLGTRAAATIVIDSFTTHVARSDVWNEAHLVRVISK